MGVTNDVRVELYRGFIKECRAPSPDEIAERLRIPIEQVRASLRKLHDQDVIALQPATEDVWLVHPFSATDAFPRRLRHTCLALDLRVGCTGDPGSYR